jgi:hypothetical protein
MPAHDLVENRDITDSNAVRAIPAHDRDRSTALERITEDFRMNAHDIMQDLSWKRKRLPKQRSAPR